MHEKYKKQLLILTGMSGAGKTVAAHSLEDVGYFVVDNLPPELLGNFWDLMNTSEDFEKVAVVIDLRVKSFYKDLIERNQLPGRQRPDPGHDCLFGSF